MSDDVLTLTLSGELDVGTQPATSAKISEALAAEPRLLVVDLREVDFLGSAGLSVLIEARRAAATKNIGMCLVANRRATLLPLELTGLATMFPVFASPEEAISSAAVNSAAVGSADVEREQASVVPGVGADVRQ